MYGLSLLPRCAQVELVKLAGKQCSSAHILEVYRGSLSQFVWFNFKKYIMFFLLLCHLSSMMLYCNVRLRNTGIRLWVCMEQETSTQGRSFPCITPSCYWGPACGGSQEKRCLRICIIDTEGTCGSFNSLMLWFCTIEFCGWRKQEMQLPFSVILYHGILAAICSAQSSW